MQNLKVILDILKEKKAGFAGHYYIPGFWNSIGYKDYSVNPGRDGEININPYSFLIECIEGSILSQAVKGKNYLNAVWEPDMKGILGNAVYSIFPRMYTAWNHYDDSKVCVGTFIKTICLLPYLKKLGIDVIYLLPVFQYSDRYKKGELGCPYAIKNIYKLSRELHEDLLGENSEELLNTEFKAFMEACHILGIKAMVDFVFRTVARDSDLIAEHPDWFYWIDLKHNDTFAPPPVEKEKELTLLNSRSLKNLYTCKGLEDYLKKFTYSPIELDSEKWEQAIARSRKTGEEVLDVVEELFGVTTVPGFPNVLNDPQPPWTDITYPKFYFDMSREVKRYVKEGQPPYILQDGVSLNLYQGEQINRELWDYVAGVVPYYQKQFGIDGARIDMGHALPEELNREIVARAKADNREFILWSEEFNPAHSKSARDNGFDFITGTMWQLYREIDKGGFTKKLIRFLTSSHIPVTGALETPDTPRFAFVHGDKRKLELLIMLNSLVPNAVPLINNGMEILEKQPMNLGLDNTEEGRFVLEKEDPMYGKLAFFDNYRLHWLNSDKEWGSQVLSKALALRKRFKDILSKRENFIEEQSVIKNSKLIFICYLDKATSKNLFIIINKDLRFRARINPGALMPESLKSTSGFIELAYVKGELDQGTWDMNKFQYLDPGEVVVGYCE